MNRTERERPPVLLADENEVTGFATGAGAATGLDILATLVAALGRAAREQASAPARARFIALLDTTLRHLRDQLGFDVTWGMLNAVQVAPGEARCVLGPALADHDPAGLIHVVDPVLAALGFPLDGTRSPASMRVDDAAGDPRLASLAQATGLQVFLGVPVITPRTGRVAGALVVGRRGAARGGEAELRLLELLAAQLANAVDYATLAQRLARSEARLEQVAGGATDAIYMIDGEGRFTYVNPQVEQLTGYPAAELLGHPFETLLPPDKRPIAPQALRRPTTGERTTVRRELEIQRRDGAARIVEDHAHTLYNDGQFAGRSGIMRDITERKRMEEALRDAHQKLNFHVENTPLAIVEWDGQLRLTRWSREAERIFGWGATEVLGKHPSEWAFIHPEDEAIANATMARLTGGADVRNVTHNRNFTRDGRVVHCEWYNSVLLDEAGIPVSVLSLVLDVTERTRLAAESAAQRASLEAKTAQLSELLAISAGFAANAAPEEMLGTVARAIGGTLGFRYVQVRMRSTEGESMIGVGFYGVDPANLPALRQPRPVEFYNQLLDERFRVGDVYYIPNANEHLRSFGAQWTVPPPPSSPEREPGRWHPEDALIAPLRARDGELIGVIFADEPLDGRVPGRETLAVLELFARQAALAIENAALYRALTERLSQVEAIGAVGTALVEERQLERVLRTVAEQIVALLDAKGCSVALLDPDEALRRPGEELELAVVVGNREQSVQGWRLPLDGSFSGAAIRAGGPIVSEDARKDPRGFAPALHRARVNAVLTVPLQTRERTVGALSVHDPRGGRFDPRDIAITTLFAQQAAVAIENARLHEQGRELAVVEERNRMAREIHDGLAQGFAGIILQLEVARSLLDDALAAEERLVRAQELARASLGEARRSVWNLRPTPLQGRSLDEALRAHTDEWSRSTGIATSFTVEGTPRPLVAEVETALLRIAQEALNNILKHAAASRVEVTLRLDPAPVLLRVCDNGRGFSAPTPEAGGGFGLTSMRERAGRIGSQIAIDSTPGAGTCVEVTVPPGVG
ncbi:MAG: hypothetical protein AVDCRST_MAG88-497 [uncultured Thermomicrobiales bacterium]|uniref:Nitrogen regulation protein B n=1 Tax=uncultured Thermomicrobiales bacterium TaxID=1645740 RepID=A0A6J4UCZ0_9BACT|nr:MAG: hypothetical protein AVDCRST_MAG88-497 [uncultured Thermomicrobiales bacterium]